MTNDKKKIKYIDMLEKHKRRVNELNALILFTEAKAVSIQIVRHSVNNNRIEHGCEYMEYFPNVKVGEVIVKMMKSELQNELKEIDKVTVKLSKLIKI